MLMEEVDVDGHVKCFFVGCWCEVVGVVMSEERCEDVVADVGIVGGKDFEDVCACFGEEDIC